MKRILCLETEWGFSTQKMRDKSSVRPLLEFLHTSRLADYVYRTVATKEDLKYYLSQMNKKIYQDYEIVYLNFHGTSQGIELPTKEPITLEGLGEMCENFQPDKFIHFGSCSTFRTSEQKILKFKDLSHARFVSGFTKKIDFIESSLLDIAYISEILKTTRRYDTIENRMEKQYGELCRKLGFVIR